MCITDNDPSQALYTILRRMLIGYVEGNDLVGHINCSFKELLQSGSISAQVSVDGVVVYGFCTGSARRLDTHYPGWWVIFKEQQMAIKLMHDIDLEQAMKTV